MIELPLYILICMAITLFALGLCGGMIFVATKFDVYKKEP